MSIRAKLVLWYTIVFAISGGALTTALYLLTSKTLADETDRFLGEEFDEFRHLALQNLAAPEQLRAAFAREVADERVFHLACRLHDTATGKDLAAVASKKLDRVLPALGTVPLSAARVYADLYVATSGKQLRVLTCPLDATPGSAYVLQLGVHNPRLERRTAFLQKYLFSILGALVVVAALGGWVLASRSLRPIDQVAAELSHIESTNLSARLAPGSTGDEVDRLRRAINRMLERLSDAFGRLQAFTADAAHELRTPLAALQCRIETTLNRPKGEAEAREALSEALTQVGQLSALVDTLLLLARMDATPDLANPGPVDVSALLRDIAEPFGLLAEQRGVTLAVEAPEPLVTQGDPTLLRRIFGNLLDNAVRYTPAGGRVAARAAREEGSCRVTVADTGIGIEPEALGHVFERFYRADASRSRDAGGVGLGLSIVQRAVELHHGRVAIQSTPGKGTEVTVWLPCRPATAPNEQGSRGA